MTISSPLDIAWDHAYWAEGPEFVAMYGISLGQGGLKVGWMELGGATTADFNPATWPDEVGTADADKTTTPGPTWTANGINGKPAIVFPDGDQMISDAYPVGITQPAETVIIARDLDDTADKGGAFVGRDQLMVWRTGATTWGMFGGTNLNTGAIVDTDPHLFDSQWDGGSSAFVIDGVTEASGNAGSNGMGFTEIGIGASLSNFTTKVIAFYGVKDSLLTAGERSDLLAWAQDHYSL